MPRSLINFKITRDADVAAQAKLTGRESWAELGWIHIKRVVTEFPNKLYGVPDAFSKKPPRELFHEYLKSSIGAFLAILLLSSIDEYWLEEE